MDICSVGNLVLFLHNGSVSVDTLSTLEEGKVELGVLVGAVKSSREDGSGSTSSVKNATCLAAYQKSLLVGTKDGRVKIISQIKPIAEYYDNTFLPAVRGFGLHKKNQEGSEASLESARDGYVQVSEYIAKSEANIREAFKLKLPNKLNGPEHSISAVTKSTINMAIESFKSIQENINLAEQQGDKAEDKEENEVPVDIMVGVQGEEMTEVLRQLRDMTVIDVMNIYGDLPGALKSLKVSDICK